MENGVFFFFFVRPSTMICLARETCRLSFPLFYRQFYRRQYSFGLTEERSRNKALLFQFPALILVDWLADKYFNIVSDVFLWRPTKLFEVFVTRFFFFFFSFRSEERITRWISYLFRQLFLSESLAGDANGERRND